MKRFYLLFTLCCAMPILAQDAPNKPPVLVEAVQKGDLAAVKEALAADPAAAKGNARYGSPLHYAVQARNKDIVALLLDKGADPTPVLMTAIDYRNKEIVALLLEKGADVNADNSSYGYGSGYTVLDRALNNGEGFDIAALLLAKGIDLEKRDREGKTILMRRAASGGGRAAIEWLLEKGAKPNARDDRGQSALDVAIGSNSAEIVTLLVDKGADVKSRDENGRTPLHAAVGRGALPMVKTFLDKGADVNAATESGDSPLHLAAAAPGALLGTLLTAGANANARNKRGDVPLHIALRAAGEPFAYGPGAGQGGGFQGGGFGRYQRLEFENVATPTASPRPEGALSALLEKTDIAIKDGLGFSPILLAIAMRDVEARDVLIERKPKMDSTTQLFDAVAQGDVVSLDKLLKAKPFLVYFRLPNGATPLHIAALWGTRGAAETLLAKGADVNARDAAGVSPLMMATARTSGVFTKRARLMAALLLEKGAELNARDRVEATALLRAVALRDEELTSLLLAKNADVTARDKTGNTALHLTATGPATEETVQTAIAKRLLDAKANPNARNLSGTTPLMQAVSSRRIEFARLLLERGALADARDGSGITPLGRLISSTYSYSYSMESGTGKATKELAAMLLEKGADPNARTDSSGETMLGRAVYSANKDIVSLLLAKKADLEAKNSNGYTPLLYAVSNGSNTGMKDVVDVLLAAGANVNAKAQNGESVLKIAKRSGNKEIIAALEAKGAVDNSPADASTDKPVLRLPVGF